MRGVSLFWSRTQNALKQRTHCLQRTLITNLPPRRGSSSAHSTRATWPYPDQLLSIVMHAVPPSALRGETSTTSPQFTVAKAAQGRSASITRRNSLRYVIQPSPPRSCLRFGPRGKDNRRIVAAHAFRWTPTISDERIGSYPLYVRWGPSRHHGSRRLHSDVLPLRVQGRCACPSSRRPAWTCPQPR